MIRVGLTEPSGVFPENWAAVQWKCLIKLRISERVKCSKGSGVGLGVQTPESTEKSPNPEVVACDCNPRAREAETGRCLGLQTRFRK